MLRAGGRPKKQYRYIFIFVLFVTFRPGARSAASPRRWSRGSARSGTDSPERERPPGSCCTRAPAAAAPPRDPPRPSGCVKIAVSVYVKPTRSQSVCTSNQQDRCQCVRQTKETARKKMELIDEVVNTDAWTKHKRANARRPERGEVGVGIVIQVLPCVTSRTTAATPAAAAPPHVIH